uniref:CULLIN_2 domain-containing protein n=1 Tax=Rhabditophanes sp. KR3021 TaxID=114890 RepID=A0AC35TI09_9BILA
MLVTEYKIQLFNKFSPSLVTAVLQLIEKERNNQSINSGLISETLQSYVYMGVTLDTGAIPKSMPIKDSTAPTFQKKDDSEKVVIHSVKNTAIYKQQFEIEFVGQTKAWYERHSAQLLEVADVPEYLMKAEGWMTAEIDRCDRLMDKSTLDPLQLCLNQSLITDHLDIFRAQFEGLLANDKQDDLRRLYTLSFGTPDAELHFTTILKKYISTYGVEKINGIADDAKDDPKMYLTSIIEIYNQFTSVVQTSFKNDKAYVEALDKAFQEIINANRVVANDRRGKKTHELVAKYADTILKKTNRIADYSNQLTAKFNGLYGDDLLREYNQIWINFLLSSSVTNGIFRYLNRHWITRKLEEGSDNVRFIINMLVTEFKNQLFDKFSPSLVTAVLQLIEKERNNQSINSGLISETLQSYVYMGITLYTGVIPTSMPTKDNTAPTFKKKDDSEKVVIRSVKNTAIYKQEFEIEFLGQTKAWYERHSAQLLEIADVPEYLMKAEDWMTAEIDRCDRLMDKSTLDPLQLCLNQSLITDHLDIFRAQFEGLLANDKKDDLRRLYTLSLGTPDAELHFTTNLKKYISTYGVEKINGIADDAKDDPKMYLTSIIEIYNQFTSVVKTSFKNDKAYVEALDKAFQEIINANRVVANDRRGKKTHELVAKYADTILKKTNRIGDSCELDEKLKDIVTVFSVKNTAIYKQEFEIEFLGQTKAWYERHSAQLLEIADVPEYLMKAEDWMTAEIDRCDRLMDKSTLDPLQLCLNQSLITDHLDIFRAQFEGLLANDKQDDLRRLYTLSFGTPDAELHFTTILKKYISTYGVEKINGIADDAKDDPKMYLTSIIEIYNQFTSVVKTSFKNDKAYVEALDKAFQEIINANRVVANDRRGKKTHELVAKYADTILKKTNRIGDSCELDEKLKDIVTVFRYIEDKDSFLQFYSRSYARRLINDLSVGDDSEMSLINSMKAICGFDYTTKLMKMNKDMALSKSVSDEFKQSRLQQPAQPKKVDFSIHILTNGSWPYKQVYTLQVPKCMKSTMEDFSSFYIQKHSGRKLTFLFDQSKGEIQCNAFAKKHIFVCLTNQMAIIMQFNDKDSCTYGELKRALQSGDTELKAALLGFAKNDILLVDGATFKVNEGKEVTEETVYLLNTNFTNKKVKIDLTKGTAKVETNKGLQTMNASIESDRKLHLEAIIVRIMKARKEMRHQQLVSDVVGFVKKRFRPEIPHIKRSIDVLIEKGYIKRDANERDLIGDSCELDEKLKDIVTVFRYIEDKDSFLQFYSRFYARRLINDLSVGDDSEMSLINSMKAICGFDYTTKLMKMNKDMALSKSVSDEFKQSRLQQSAQPKKVDFSIHILTNGSWPYKQVYTLQVPKCMKSTMEDFSSFYIQKHSGRKLTFLFDQSKGEIQCNVFAKKHIFVCLTNQMAVIMQFNDKDSCTYGELKRALQSGDTELKAALLGFAKSDILLVDGATFKVNEGKEVTEETVYLLNTNFTNKKVKIDLTKGTAKVETNKGLQTMNASIESDRKLHLEAIIVRIMKARKEMRHQQLVSDVVGFVKKRFRPEIPHIKRSIDVLIEKGYIKRDANERDLYQYLA